MPYRPWPNQAVDIGEVDSKMISGPGPHDNQTLIFDIIAGFHDCWDLRTMYSDTV